MFGRRSQGFGWPGLSAINRFSASQHVTGSGYGSTALSQPFCLKTLSCNEQRGFESNCTSTVSSKKTVFGEAINQGCAPTQTKRNDVRINES